MKRSYGKINGKLKLKERNIYKRAQRTAKRVYEVTISLRVWGRGNIFET